MNELESIRKHSLIVADTGDFDLIKKFRPHDCTTNPSLIKQACSMPQYKRLIDSAVEIERQSTSNTDILDRIVDRLIVLFGVEILNIVPGKVSTEIDASLSFNVEGMVHKALHLLELYSSYQVKSDRIYLKIPATWEGIQAANMAQALACAQVGVDLISPFVGRITDFYKNEKKMVIDTPEQDPGVQNVRKIFSFYKKHKIETRVMGASFRNVGQIKALCGLDALTISPKLLDELNSATGTVEPLALDSDTIEYKSLDEKSFRWWINSEEVASVKLAEGIRLFHADTEKLKEEIGKLIHH